MTIVDGDLRVLLRDNSQSPKVLLSGVDSLFNLRDAPEFDAFDPDSRPGTAGLNFEHVICGHQNAHNKDAPRIGKFELFPQLDAKAATLVRKRENDPWAISASMMYAVRKPNCIDVDFRCTPHDRSLFGPRGYAVFFFANYMNDVEQVALNFRGIEQANQEEKWVTADAPRGHPDWNQGGTYRSAAAPDLAYDADHDFRLNLWSYDYPRFTQPFYYGRAAHGMTLIMMFDKMYSETEEIRFSLFKFKLRRFPRPAWDFQYVLRRIEEGKDYGFKARLVWKKFISPEDCAREYERWRATL